MAEDRPRDGTQMTKDRDDEHVERTDAPAEQTAQTGSGDAQPDREETAPQGTPFTQQLGRIALAVVAILFGVFAVVNAQHVSFDWIFGSTAVKMVNDERVSGGVPLIVLMVGSFIAGGLVGWLATWRRTRR